MQASIKHMDFIKQAIQVRWDHQVYFTNGVFECANPLLAGLLVGNDTVKSQRALVVVDERVAVMRPELIGAIEGYFATVCPEVLLTAVMVYPGGEVAKASWTQVETLLAAIEHHHIDRHSYLVAVGGGALLDMVGLAATLAHRGVRHVRLPTTLLAQCDSGVGVKNGINAFGKKNFIGSFAPPFAVVNDEGFLTTLPAREMRCGFVEAVKVACIRDVAFFVEMEREAEALMAGSPEPVRRLIRRCAELHVNHIALGGDPFEYGSARPLDFGHWAAHKLEQMSGFSLRHGEAVAIGIALDVTYSKRAGFLDEASSERVLGLLEKLGLELSCADMVLKNADGFVILEGLEEFREHLGGRTCITLLDAIGHGFEVHHLDHNLVGESIAELAKRKACHP